MGEDQPGGQDGECSKRSYLIQDPWEEISLAEKLESVAIGQTCYRTLWRTSDWQTSWRVYLEVRPDTGPLEQDKLGRQAGECSKRSDLIQDPWVKINLADKEESVARGQT